MKKFIFTANVIAIILMVPAVLFGYLHNSGTKETAAQENTVKGEPVSGQTATSIFGLVKTF